MFIHMQPPFYTSQNLPQLQVQRFEIQHSPDLYWESYTFNLEKHDVKNPQTSWILNPESHSLVVSEILFGSWGTATWPYKTQRTLWRLQRACNSYAIVCCYHIRVAENISKPSSVGKELNPSIAIWNWSAKLLERCSMSLRSPLCYMLVQLRCYNSMWILVQPY